MDAALDFDVADHAGRSAALHGSHLLRAMALSQARPDDLDRFGAVPRKHDAAGIFS